MFSLLLLYTLKDVHVMRGGIMKLKNDFTDSTRILFMDKYACAVCDCNRNLQLHHITGRVSNSPLNAVPVCDNCHSRMGHTELEERGLFKYTCINILRDIYKPTQDDLNFVNSFPHLVSLIKETKKLSEYIKL